MYAHDDWCDGPKDSSGLLNRGGSGKRPELHRDSVVIIKLDKKGEGRDGGQQGCYKRAKRVFWVEQ